MDYRIKLACTVLAGLTLFGCSSKGDVHDEDAPVVVEGRDIRFGEGSGSAPVEVQAVTETPAVVEEGVPVESDGAQLGGEFQGDPLADDAGLLGTRVVYFEFDSNDVPHLTFQVLAAHADYLIAHPDTVVTLVGHTDERGSREYNLALGERRAQAVAQVMYLQGVAKEQVEIISFGEERPAVPGHDEEAWRLNRRVELVYPGY